MLREFFLGFIKIHILHHAAQAPLYGAAMMAELRRHGYEISPGTLYPLLHALEEQGYLVSASRVVEGRVRKYYAATEAGKQALAETLPRLRELVEEVLEGNGPPSLPDPSLESEEG
jgi:PadR family transcriptional regulator PadR